jgi:uncharacterized membrane protein (DUF485 family)
MNTWLRWLLTVFLLAVCCIFLMWAVQTAWLGSFPDRDKSKYGTWAALQLGGAIVSALILAGIWISRWRKIRSER